MAEPRLVDSQESGILPESLEIELLQLREDYRMILGRFSRGDYSSMVDLSGLELRLSRILAREARIPLPRRRVRLTQLALAINQLFPELQPWREIQLREAEKAALARAISKHSSKPVAS